MKSEIGAAVVVGVVALILVFGFGMVLVGGVWALFLSMGMTFSVPFTMVNLGKMTLVVYIIGFVVGVWNRASSK